MDCTRISKKSEQGTVFVHGVATLQSTFVNRAKLTLKYPKYLQLSQVMGITVDRQEEIEENENRQLTIPLGNIQYGQSRDLFLVYKPTDELRQTLRTAKADGTSDIVLPVVNATLEYSHMASETYETATRRNILDGTNLPEAEIAYHTSRAAICAFLASFFPLDDKKAHVPRPWSEENRALLANLVETLPCASFVDPQNTSLMQDLTGPEPKGQVRLALNNLTYYKTWGRHYLPSLQNAHARQLCNSFKDPGPLQYGRNSPLFVKCRDKLDKAFDRIPAPIPSRRRTTHTRPINMSCYNRSSNPCFAGFCRVRLAGQGEGEKGMPISRLRKGMDVASPRGPRKVVAIVKTRVQREMMCRVGGAVVTPWHPVLVPGEDEGSTGPGKWCFPTHVAEGPKVRYTGSIYSVLLEQDQDVGAHAIFLGAIWGVTLGHGVLPGSRVPGNVENNDVRAHSFFGSYRAVVRNLASLGVTKNGLVVSGGVRRGRESGMVSGFRRPPSPLTMAGRPGPHGLWKTG